MGSGTTFLEKVPPALSVVLGIGRHFWKKFPLRHLSYWDRTTFSPFCILRIGTTADRALGGENPPFQNISHGGSRGALVHLLPMKPSAKEFQDSDKREPPNSVRMDVLVNDIFWKKSPCAKCRIGDRTLGAGKSSPICILIIGTTADRPSGEKSPRFGRKFWEKISPAPSVVLISELQFLGNFPRNLNLFGTSDPHNLKVLERLLQKTHFRALRGL